MYITRVFLLFVGFSVRIFSIIKLLFSLKLFFVNSKRTASTLPLSFQHQELHTIKSSIANLSKMRSGMKHFIEKFFSLQKNEHLSALQAYLYIRFITLICIMSDVHYSSYLQMTFWFGRKKIDFLHGFLDFALFNTHTRTYFNSPEKKWK